MIEVYDSK
jgi:hypothetical protein